MALGIFARQPGHHRADQQTRNNLWHQHDLAIVQLDPENRPDRLEWTVIAVAQRDKAATRRAASGMAGVRYRVGRVTTDAE